MVFLNPTILIALAAIGVPIVLHYLFQKRKTIINFSSLHFIKQIEDQKRIKSSWLEYILLLLRILTIAFVVLAFAKPASSLNLPLSGKEQEHHFLLVQNDRYLNIRLGEESAGRAMRGRVQDWLNSAQTGDMFHLVSPQGDIRQTAAARIMAALSELRPTRQEARSLTQQIEHIKQYADAEGIGNYSVHLFAVSTPEEGGEALSVYASLPSDFTFTNNGVLSAKLSQAALVAGAPLSLDVRFESPAKNTPELLVVVDGKTVFQRFLTDSNAAQTIAIGSFAEGKHAGYVRLLTEDSYAADNTFYFNFTIQKSRRVLVLADNQNSVLRSLFTDLPDSSIVATVGEARRSLRYALADYSTVFFEGAPQTASIARQLSRYISQKQGHLVFVPTAEIDALSFNRSALSKYVTLRGSVGELSESPRTYIIPRSDIQSEALPSFYQFGKKKQREVSYRFLHRFYMPNGEAIIGKQSRFFLGHDAENQLFVFGAPLTKEATSFIYDARFVPMLYGLAFADQARVHFDEAEGKLTLRGAPFPEKVYLKDRATYGAPLLRRQQQSAVYATPANIENGTFALSERGDLVSINDARINAANLLRGDQIREGAASRGGQFQHWRLCLLLAFLFYAAELWLGRGRT